MFFDPLTHRSVWCEEHRLVMSSHISFSVSFSILTPSPYDSIGRECSYLPGGTVLDTFLSSHCCTSITSMRQETVAHSLLPTEDIATLSHTRLVPAFHWLLDSSCYRRCCNEARLLTLPSTHRVPFIERLNGQERAMEVL